MKNTSENNKQNTSSRKLTEQDRLRGADIYFDLMGKIKAMRDPNSDYYKAVKASQGIKLKEEKYLNEAHRKNSEGAMRTIAEQKKSPLSFKEKLKQLKENSVNKESYPDTSEKM